MQRHVLRAEAGIAPLGVLALLPLLLGLGLPDDNAHSPNEKMSLTAFTKGMQMSAALWQNLAAHS